MRINLILCSFSTLIGLTSFAAIESKDLKYDVRSVSETPVGVYFQLASPSDAVVIHPFTETIITRTSFSARRSQIFIELRRKAIVRSPDQVNPAWKGLSTINGELKVLSNCILRSQVLDRLLALQVHEQPYGDTIGGDQRVCMASAFVDNSKADEVVDVLRGEAQEKTLMRAQFSRLNLRIVEKSALKFPAKDMVKPIANYLSGQGKVTSSLSEAEAWFSLGVAAARSQTTNEVLGRLDRYDVSSILYQLMPIFYSDLGLNGKQAKFPNETDVKEILVEKVVETGRKSYEF